MMIISRTPTRIGLFGGSTDVEPFASEYGGKVLNMAINIRHECQLLPLSWPMKSCITAMNEDRCFRDCPPPHSDSKFSLMYQIVQSYGSMIKNPFSYLDEFSGIQSAGLGSSASAAVAMIGVFDRWLGLNHTKEEIAERAWRMETDLGWVSGKQDQYASALGGVNFFEFDGKVWNEPINKGVADSFVEWCLLVYTGRTRHSAKLQNVLKRRMETSGETIRALKRMRTLAWEGRDALKRGKFVVVGDLLRESWNYKKETNPEVTNHRIDSFAEKAYSAGARGCKVLGAGGEGHMLIVADPKYHQAILRTTHLKKIDFSIDYNGLEVRTT